MAGGLLCLNASAAAASGLPRPTAYTNIPSAPGGVTAEAVSCIPQLQAVTSGSNLTKSLTGAKDNRDGTFTLSFTYRTTRANGTYTVRDCAFRDTNANRIFDSAVDPVVGSTTKQSVTIRNGRGSSAITVYSARSSVVCDRLSLSRSSSINDSSVISCLDLTRCDVPQSAAGALGLAALVSIGFGIAYVANKRRVRTARALLAVS